MAKWLEGEALGDEIRKVRKRAKLTQDVLAKRLGLPLPSGQTQVSAWERGRGATPETIERIAAALKVDPVVFQVGAPPSDLVPISPRDAAEIRDLLRAAKEALDDAYARVDRAVSRRPEEEESERYDRAAEPRSSYGPRKRRVG